MTRNTKLYKTKGQTPEVFFRDLNTEELAFLGNIKNEIKKADLAAGMAIVEPEISKVEWQVRLKVGREAMINSTQCVNDDALFEITVKEFRKKVKDDFALWSISKIRSVFPGESLINLLKLTHKDLIELVCFCELVTEQNIFNIGTVAKRPKKGMRLVNVNDVPGAAAALKQQIRDLNKVIG